MERLDNVTNKLYAAQREREGRGEAELPGALLPDEQFART